MNRFWISAGVLSVFMAVSVGAAAGPSHAASSSQIVFAANRSPQVNGEVYRVNSNGARVDLSNSPALDADPSVSPDGKKVAFVSTRGGHVAVYLVGTDGRGAGVSRRLSGRSDAEGRARRGFTWTADSRTFALAANGSNPGEGGLYVRGAAGWRVAGSPRDEHSRYADRSHDGSMIAYTTNDDTVRVLSPSGKHLWTVSGGSPPGWE